MLAGRPTVYWATMATYKGEGYISTDEWNSSNSECDMDSVYDWDHLPEPEWVDSTVESSDSERDASDHTGQAINWANWSEYEGDSEQEGEERDLYPGWKNNMVEIEHYARCGDDELYWKLRDFMKVYFKFEVERDMIQAALLKLWDVQEFRCWMTTKVYIKCWQIDLQFLGGSDRVTEAELREDYTAMIEFMSRLSNYMSDGIIFIQPRALNQEGPSRGIRDCEMPWKYTSQELLTELTLMIHDFIRQGKM